MPHSTLLLLLLTVMPLVLAVTGSTHSTRRAPFACAPNGPAAHLPFCSVPLNVHERARDLVGRLTMEEKAAMLGDNATAVPRLGIGAYQWWSEALHGVAVNGYGVQFGGDFPFATSFPQVITTAATFNASLWELIGKTVSDEGRAMYNYGQGGLTYWSPNVNIFRDPRWGRGQETPGEDPLMSGRYAAAYVQGLQQMYGGKHGHARLKVAACCKHFTAYDLENWNGVDRYHFDATVSKQDLEDTFNVPFKACVTEGRAASVMCSYNQVNNVPTCADESFLNGTVRGQWGLNGYIGSDCDSVAVMFGAQHFGATPEDAVASTLKAGLDLDCGTFLSQHVVSAIQQGKITKADLDNAVTNTLVVQMRLGMYNGDPAGHIFGELGPNDVCSAAHQDLALEAARQGIVLLKNDGNTLPFSPTQYRSIAVVGPNSDATLTLIGSYAGRPCQFTSPLQGISKYTQTIHQAGCNDVSCQGAGQPIDAAVTAARNADATVIVAGLDQTIEAEGIDRLDVLLPGRQQELVSKVAAASKGPVILVMMTGGPIDVSFAQKDPKVPSILWVGYPGQAGGQAIADVIFGIHNPGGKLPMTWYPQEYLPKVPMTNMAMRADPAQGYPGRTYRFYSGPVVYPFGHGLSYTKFQHTLAQAPTQFSIPLNGVRPEALNSTVANQAVQVEHSRCDGLNVSVHVDVKNVGDRDGAHTVFVYSTPPAAGHSAPIKQLVAFEKVYVAAGGQSRVVTSVDVCKDMSVAGSDGVRRIPTGEHKLQIGDLAHPISFTVEGL